MTDKAEFYIERKCVEHKVIWVIYHLRFNSFFDDYLYSAVDRKSKFIEAYEVVKQIRANGESLNNVIDVKFKDKTKYRIEDDSDLVFTILKAE
jgi:hypothetical protein